MNIDLIHKILSTSRVQYDAAGDSFEFDFGASVRARQCDTLADFQQVLRDLVANPAFTAGHLAELLRHLQ
ncbi:hypothetical protein [Aeoliella sp.]|uniref:hypothetical protein n=1 Tax=Aeoliella sp. TaxID=2795800 RepID=UPI003CCBB17E